MITKSAAHPWRRFRIGFSHSHGMIASIKYSLASLAIDSGGLMPPQPRNRVQSTHFYIAAAPLAAGFLSYP